MSRPGADERSRLRRAAAAILKAGLEAADPYALVHDHLHRSGELSRTRGRVALVAVGKAAPAMARAAEDALGGALGAGIVVSQKAEDRSFRSRVLIAGHPLPDARGVKAGAAVLAMARGLGKDDLLLLLLSGGASAMLPAPAPGIGLRQKAAVTSLLLGSGATIAELNTVRKHLSRVKGGGLARVAAPARVLALVLSDVPGDDLATIASGPVTADPTTYADAAAVLRRYGAWRRTPAPVRRHLEAGARGAVPETPKPGDPVFDRVTARVVGGNALSVEAAVREARRQGLKPLVLTTRLEGEARDVARGLVAILRECVERGRPGRPPVCLLAGGETTVTVRGAGRGGRNQEIAVSAAAALAGFPVPAVVASLATDGVDGSSGAAGGVADDLTVARTRALGMAPLGVFLDENDTAAYLAPLGDLIVTGPTGTNVADLTALLAARRR